MKFDEDLYQEPTEEYCKVSHSSCTASMIVLLHWALTTRSFVFILKQAKIFFSFSTTNSIFICPHSVPASSMKMAQITTMGKLFIWNSPRMLFTVFRELVNWPTEQCEDKACHFSSTSQQSQGNAHHSVNNWGQKHGNKGFACLRTNIHHFLKDIYVSDTASTVIRCPWPQSPTS